ncbi:MAG: PKD domain-containing protein [Fimbriimonadaceae bacterium]|nr:PKD domain-containing protein [Fimbriimonadaceae bacterium]
MTKIWTTIAFGAAAVGVFAQNPALYNPARTIEDQKISVRGWGSGSIAQTDELAYQGVYSIRISTRNFFQGGIITMNEPIDMKSAYADKNNLLRFTIRVADLNTTLGGGGTRGGGLGTSGGGGAGNAVGDDGGGGQGNRGSGAGSSGSTVSMPVTSLKNLRLIVTTTDGKKSEAYIAVNTSMTMDRGWLNIASPLKTITGLDKTNMQIKEIAISGDAVTTFYIGEIRVVNDTTPITGDIGQGDMNLALGDEVTFSARGFGGASILKYTWDFDAKDGIQVDAEGQAVKRKFRKAGTYTVTLTISDANGLKTPYKATIKVKVNP